MDWRKRLVGMALGKSCLDKKLAQEDHDFSELGVCLVRWSRYCSEVESETSMLKVYDDFRHDRLV